MNKQYLSFLFLLMSFISVFSQNKDAAKELFQKGNEQYKNGSFYESVESYEAILAMGFDNFETYYNLGNAYYKSNQLPEAIYSYEKALHLKPRHEDAKHNLVLANSMIHKEIQSVPEAFHIRMADTFMKLLNVNSWAILTILLFTLTLLCIAYFLLQTSLKFKRTMFFLSVLGIFLTSSAWFMGYRLYSSMKEPRHGIVMISSAGIKSSPDKTSADVYVSQAGTKVKIISRIGDWYEVRVPDGNKGWIQANEIRLL
jgi:tetratricopeptide (TPR) repeat protein